MNRKPIVLAAVALVALPLIWWAVTFHRAKTQYEELRAGCNSIAFEVSRMTADDRAMLDTVRQTWELKREGQFGSDEMELIRQLGYSADVEGLVRLWSEPMPPFSATDLDRNAIWVARAVYRNVNWPLQLPYRHADGLLFATKEGYAELYEDTKNGIKFYAWSPKPPDDQDGNRRPGNCSQRE